MSNGGVKQHSIPVAQIKGQMSNPVWTPCDFLLPFAVPQFASVTVYLVTSFFMPYFERLLHYVNNSVTSVNSRNVPQIGVLDDPRLQHYVKTVLHSRLTGFAKNI